MSLAIKIYHCLPPFPREIAASLHGYRLRRWRYSGATDCLVRAALERERWPAENWSLFQNARLRSMLQHAYQGVPYYRSLWRKLCAAGAAPENLHHWPVLTKATLRASPEAFLADDAPRRRLREEWTSGTTGTPLRLWHRREVARQWYALMEARWRGWQGVSRHDCWAILGGQMVTPAHQNRPPFWVWNAGLRQLYLSSSHLRPDYCVSYLEEMRRRKVKYIWGYPSSLYSLALFIHEKQLPVPALQVAISNAELLHQHQRDLIQHAFACPVIDTYGMTERVCAASECEHGRLHLWPCVGIAEVLSDRGDFPVADGEVGRLVCTGLLNRDMPLIRYETGDRAALAPPEERCPCGRTLPVLRSIEGREDDVIMTPDGRRVGRLDPVFKGDCGVREAQVIQESPNTLRVRLVPDRAWKASCGDALIRALRQRVGEMAITLECVAGIPRGANGKFRAVISRVSPSARSKPPRPPHPSEQSEAAAACRDRIPDAQTNS